MGDEEDGRRRDGPHGGAEGRRHKTRPQSHRQDSGPERRQELYLGFLTKTQLVVASVTVGLVLLLTIITVTAVVLTNKSGTLSHIIPECIDSSTRVKFGGSTSLSPSMTTGGDMLDFLVQSGEISERDGLLATWFHRANRKEEMNNALASDAMILEADVTLEGYGTPGEKPIPIMAHPPDKYSDNTLDQWLDAVLASRKGIKLDFKALASVGLSLDLLREKNSSGGINQPVWLNADILQGPNVPDFILPVNGTRFLQLIQEKFSDVTLSPGWKVAYGPPLFNGTYTRLMVEDMYNMIKDVPQKVTFPVHALLVRSGWQHISWLLSQSPRFSLTLWQGSIHPNVSDLLFIRDNTHPAQVYYDIYEPTLSAFKQAANGAGGMLVVRVTSDDKRPGVPLVEGSGESSEPLMLQDVLQQLEQSADVPWGVYLRIHTQQLLEVSLMLLCSAYSREKLYRPVWISMDGMQSSDHAKEYVSTVERLFPYVTLVLTEQNWPPQIPATVAGLSQRVALHLNTASVPSRREELHSLLGMMDRFDLIVEEDTKSRAEALSVLKGRMTKRKGRANTNLYVISDRS
ncbi:hypothetical protein F2P81_001126 [Scophthalmus maximus]|uniref:Protein FAM151A n=1 Tax=Scophthalmus maximus TaxID=52904 RepID=A0A6A4TMU5_SCOMX|nr:hypothetical protein F2P81_001126 [Scophthalmus maximus]